MKIFISYSRLDSDLGKAAYDYLSGTHEVFIDTKKIAGGDEWEKEIQTEISKCDRFVLILTLSSINRDEVKKEINLAINKEKKIIPCIDSNLEIKKIPSEISKYHGIQFDECPDLGRKLLKMINDDEKIHQNNGEKNQVTNTYEGKQNFEQPTSLKTYLENAKTFEMLNQNEDALRTYNQALKLDPHNNDLLLGKVLLLYKMEKFNDALLIIDKVIFSNPKQPKIWYYKGIVLEKLERYDKALEALDSDLYFSNLREIEFSNNINIETLYAKANILPKVGEHKEAVKAFEAFLIEKQKKDELMKLLKEGDVGTFKKRTKSYETRGNKEHGYTQYDREFTPRLIFVGSQIFNANLENIDLHEADLCFAYLKKINFSHANFCWANLAGVHADGAKFISADLQNAYLSQTNLTKVDFSFANLSNAYFLKSNLTGTIFNNADLSNAILVGCTDYIGLECQNADFKGAIIDNDKLIDHLRNNKPKNDKDFSSAIKSKGELELRLQEKGYNRDSRIYSKILERTLLKD